jgi:hypothetical protein
VGSGSELEPGWLVVTDFLNELVADLGINFDEMTRAEIGARLSELVDAHRITLLTALILLDEAYS